MVGRLSHLLFSFPKIAGSIRPLVVQHFALLSTHTQVHTQTTEYASD
jgi:hypothetical protein